MHWALTHSKDVDSNMFVTVVTARCSYMIYSEDLCIDHNLQISTSVNWRRTHAMSMPTALTQMAVSTARVGKVLKEMGSIVQVNSTFVHKVYVHA